MLKTWVTTTPCDKRRRRHPCDTHTHTLTMTTSQHVASHNPLSKCACHNYHLTERRGDELTQELNSHCCLQEHWLINTTAIIEDGNKSAGCIVLKRSVYLTSNRWSVMLSWHFVAFFDGENARCNFLRRNVWEIFVWGMSGMSGSFVQVNFSHGVVPGISVRIVRNSCLDTRYKSPYM